VTATEAATNDRERLQGIFKLASDIGIGIVNIGSGGTTGDEESTKSSIELMRDFAKMAGDAGVKLAVKPHVGQAIYNADTGLRLMEEVTEPAMASTSTPVTWRAPTTTRPKSRRAGAAKSSRRTSATARCACPARLEHPSSRFPDAARSTCPKFYNR
jgi:sugar phosphate isomerase/epimerase